MKSILGHPALLRRAVGAGICLSLALLAAFASMRTISLMPFGIAPRSLQQAGAEAHVVVDRPQNFVGNGAASSDDLDVQWKRAVLVANLLSSEPAVARLGKRAGINPADIYAFTQITANVP